MSPWWLIGLGFIFGVLTTFPWHRKRRPATLVLVLPTLTSKEDTPIPNYELSVAAVASVPIQTLDAGGNPVSPPAGDVFTVASSNTAALGTAVGTMPSGPLQGQPAAILTPLTSTPTPGITVTLTDSDGLTAGVQIVDLVADPPVTDFLDISAAVTAPQPPPA